MQLTEGYMPYCGYQTYYRVIGDLKNEQKPLVLLHGGPGSAHNYFELLDPLAADGRALVMYDQLGCGRSATPSRPDLWTAETWVKELMALREHLDLRDIHLLGQSWGGMLAIQYLCDQQPEGINSLILSSTLPSADLWAQEQMRLIRLLPEDQQQAIRRAIANDNFTEPDYLAANEHLMLRHSAAPVTADSPEPLRRKKASGREAYVTAWGPNEFYPKGTLKGWDYRHKLPDLSIPTLITSGTDDLSTPLIAKTMQDLIPNARWELFAQSRHMPFVEETHAYLSLLEHWLPAHD